MSNRSDEETSEPLLADHRNYYKVEEWTKTGRVERMLYAGSNLDRPVCCSRAKSNAGRAFG
jgi:hypothetical protein